METKLNRQRQMDTKPDEVITETWTSPDPAMTQTRTDIAIMFNRVDNDRLNSSRFGINKLSDNSVELTGKRSDIAKLSDVIGMVNSAEHRMATQISDRHMRRRIAMAAAREVVAEISSSNGR